MKHIDWYDMLSLFQFQSHDIMESEMISELPDQLQNPSGNSREKSELWRDQIFESTEMTED
jgi:hypothetical protein